jgi:hypothetical protein
MPIADMRYLLEIHPDPKFISYLTIGTIDTTDFISEFETELCKNKTRELNLFGPGIQSLDPSIQPKHIKIYKSIPEFVNQLSL